MRSATAGTPRTLTRPARASSVFRPAAPALGNNSPTTADSRACRDSVSGPAQARRSTDRQHRPSLALTRWYASQTTHLEIANDLPFGFGPLIRSSHLAVVD